MTTINWVKNGPHWDGYIGDRKIFEINRYSQGYTKFCALYRVDDARQVLLLNTADGLKATKLHAAAIAKAKGE